MRDTYIEVIAQLMKICPPCLEKELMHLGSMRDVEITS
jgi:hypothetical protein